MIIMSFWYGYTYNQPHKLRKKTHKLVIQLGSITIHIKGLRWEISPLKEENKHGYKFFIHPHKDYKHPLSRLLDAHSFTHTLGSFSRDILNL